MASACLAEAEGPPAQKTNLGFMGELLEEKQKKLPFLAQQQLGAGFS